MRLGDYFGIYGRYGGGDWEIMVGIISGDNMVGISG